MPRIPLAQVSIDDLKAEIARRAKKAAKNLGKLLKQRAKLDKAIADLQSLAGHVPAFLAKATPATVTPSSKPGPMPKAMRATGKPLGEYVIQVLDAAGKGLHIKEIEAAVRKAGYPTKAKALYNQIATVVSKGSFEKVRKGIYALATGKNVPAKKAAAKYKPSRKRQKYAQTGEQFILGLVKGKGATTAEITKAWKAAGRSGKADNYLMKVVATKKVLRKKLKRGSLYTLA